MAANPVNEDRRHPADHGAPFDDEPDVYVPSPTWAGRLPGWVLPLAALLVVGAVTGLYALARSVGGDDDGSPTAAVGASGPSAADPAASDAGDPAAAVPVAVPAATGVTAVATPADGTASDSLLAAQQANATGTVASPDGPSQSANDATRDGVPPAVAALTNGDRRLVEAQWPMGDGRTWVLSRLPPETLAGLDAASKPALANYGEVLLLGAGGAIERAWPMPGAPPNWLVVTSAGVWAGHDGDGALPDSTLARIDPGSLTATVVVIPSETEATGATWPAGWHVAAGDDVFDYRGVIGFGSGGMSGTRAVSPLGDVVVSLDSIDGLINRVAGTG